jgi:hypothetical protein
MTLRCTQTSNLFVYTTKTSIHDYKIEIEVRNEDTMCCISTLSIRSKRLCYGLIIAGSSTTTCALLYYLRVCCLVAFGYLICHSISSLFDLGVSLASSTIQVPSTVSHVQSTLRDWNQTATC